MELKPGYKQTEIGVIPEDWEVIPLGKISRSVASGKSKKKKAIGAFAFYGSTGIIGHCDDYDYVGAKLLVARVGANAGSLYRVDGSYSVSDNTLIVDVLCQDHLIYLSYYLDYINLNRIVFGSGQPLVTGNQIKKILIPKPQDLEIKKITEALSDFDSLIKSLEKLIEKKKLIKQGVMQELLTGKRRLPGFSGEWETKSFGDIAEIVGGGTPKTNNPRFWNGNINWFTPTEIGINKYSFISERRITREGLLSSSAKLLPIGTILLTSRAGIGDASILMSDGCTNQGFQSLVPKEGFYNEFLYYRVLTLKDVLIQNASGSTFLEISPNRLKQIEILYPPMNEQLAIAKFLSDMDSEIKALEDQLSKYRLLKQAMMQELLTGRIRLI